MSKLSIATCWLEGCSGCHMSLLDIDERLIQVAANVVLTYGPLVDTKEFPAGVDATLVEGGIGNVEQMEMIRLIRERSNIIISFGDCAVTGNIPGMRNKYRASEVLHRAYAENSANHTAPPSVGVPKLLPRAIPVHEVVTVDLFIPGCPPPADVIFFALDELLHGRVPEIGGRSRFGA